MLAESLMVYSLPMAMIMAYHFHRRQRETQRSTSARKEAVAAGLTEPASLHPVIDQSKCLGCGSCVAACPEGEIIGLINGKADLIEPSQCIGHGACKTACPANAITLVFGTERRGVDIPAVGSDFQTNVPGIYIAGELGGMGLIRNAIEQGRRALDAIAKAGRGSGSGSDYDVVIIGAGPAGFSASLAAKEKGLKYVTVEQDSLGGTVSHFPRGKLVMTQPATLPIVGKVKFRETTKEELLGFWTKVLDDTKLDIRFQERVDVIAPLTAGDRPGTRFEVRTSGETYRTRAVLLAIGRRGTPRKLDVPGEDMSKVVYRLIDPAQYEGQHVLVVGGGDSAIEAAVSIAEETNATVTLSYRGDAFNRTKLKNREKIETAVANRRVTVLFKSSVKKILKKSVDVRTDGGTVTLENDAIVVCAGGILPTKFLKDTGIDIETKYGMA